MRRKDAVELLKRLLQEYPIEEIAFRLGVSASTVYYWSRGVTKPSYLAYKEMERLMRSSPKSWSNRKGKGI